MIELADLIGDLRRELEAAIAAAPEDGLRFEVGPAELEVSIAIEKAAKVGTKVKFWVMETGADGSLGRTSTHRLKLTLLPKVGAGGASAYVRGDEVERER
ncbi:MULTISPECIES: trypco2 family protein [unclassified Streptomyces]|uniref:trypco2 family protein n=1 Tax=unclassified Streptomyces TaxID=2593676 RepID=UPI0022540F15|nr:MULTISPECIES: trypco2 family protein [unclassified Streptomyces]MCX5327908.1 hypothetical protein [Streptomyces sp. NBC_00140]MCX5357397.1 hypothetical protein [Streptomyces sp. NBC_00124]